MNQQIINAGRDTKNISQTINGAEKKWVQWVQIVIAIIGAIALIVAEIISVMGK